MTAEQFEAKVAALIADALDADVDVEDLISALEIQRYALIEAHQQGEDGGE